MPNEQFKLILSIFTQLRTLERRETRLVLDMQACEILIIKHETADAISSLEARYFQKRPSNRQSQIQTQRSKMARLQGELDDVRAEIAALEESLEPVAAATEADPHAWLLPSQFQQGSDDGSQPQDQGSSVHSRSMHYSTPGQHSTINDMPSGPAGWQHPGHIPM